MFRANLIRFAANPAALAQPHTAEKSAECPFVLPGVESLVCPRVCLGSRFACNTKMSRTSAAMVWRFAVEIEATL